MTKENLVIWPIIRYVTSLVSQAGETPQLLPGELVLCEKFGVALKGQVGKSNTLAKSRLWQSTTSDTCSGYDIGAYKAHPGGMSMVHLDGSGGIANSLYVHSRCLLPDLWNDGVDGTWIKQTFR